jgi:plastocyanin
MLHNNLSAPDQVWITYDIDLVPATSPMAATLKPAIPIWMDVQNGSAYPVFNALKGHGKNGQFTYPDEATDAYPTGIAKNEWVLPEDGVLLTTAGHLHPGGLHDDLWLTRAGAHAPRGKAKPGSSDTVHLYRSVADYFEPAGKVSWDFAVTGTPASWRPIVNKGDVLSITSTYDTKNASWYESMGIMVVWMAPAVTAGGTDPFATPVDASGELTHGHLSENDQHGGKKTSDYADLTKASSQVVSSGTVVPIMDFAYAQGNMAAGNTTVPAVVQGGTLTFRNDDASKNIYHTITACRAPCDLTSGIAYPIANAKIQFDSGELGHGGPPSSGSVTWSIPRNLPPGTYTYFCRIHPFMRGAFRVLPSKS